MLMVAGRHGGRPPLPGPRYDCGRRKRPENPRGQQIWRRIKDTAIAAGLDPKAGTQLNHFAILGLLTEAEVAAGGEVARIYNEYRRWHGQRTSPASPGYMRASPGTNPDDELFDPDLVATHEQAAQRSSLDRTIRRAELRWLRIQEWVHVLPPGPAQRTLGALERLCVEDLEISRAEITLVAPMLAYFAQKFGMTAQGHASPSIAISGRRPGPPARRRIKTRPDLMREAWETIARVQYPEWSEAELAARWRAIAVTHERLRAEADRERFRADKRRRRV